MTENLIDQRAFVSRIHHDALQLAEQVRGFLTAAQTGRVRDYPSHEPADRGVQLVETMRLSNRLMHVIAWTLLHKAVNAGEVGADEPTKPDNRLSHQKTPPPTKPARLTALPNPVRQMIVDSERLLDRALRWEDDFIDGMVGQGRTNPVHDLQDLARRLT